MHHLVWFCSILLCGPFLSPARAQNRALGFDGTNAYAQASGVVLRPDQSFTVEAWIFRQDSSGTNSAAAVTKTTTGWLTMSPGDWALGWFRPGDKTASFSVFGRSFSASRTMAFSEVGQWTHLAGVYDTANQEAILYIDGFPWADAPLTMPLGTNSAPITIGRIGTEFLHGLVDEVRIWNIARTETQIAGSWLTRLTGTESNLVAYWRMDEGSGSTVADSSGHNATAQLLNGATWVEPGAPLRTDSFSVTVAPHFSGGRQAKVSTELIDWNRGISYQSRLIDQGEGYSSTHVPPLFFVSSTGSGASGWAGVNNYNGGAYFFLAEQGLVYSDDATIVIGPPHTNDFQAALDNLLCNVIQLRSGLYFQNAVIARDLTIRGEGIGRTTVSGGLMGSVFRILPGVTVHLEDMTIIDGLAPSGGGIFNDGRLFVTRCEIKDCRAYAYLGGEGGGIFNRGGASLTVRDSSIHHNAAARNGGGISSSGFNLSRLPAGGGGSASNVLGRFRQGLSSLRRPSALAGEDEANSVNEQASSNMVQTVSGYSNDSTKDVLTRTLVEPFGNAEGWLAIGSPVVTVSNCTLTANQVGIGAANASVPTRVCLDFVVYEYCFDTHAPDPRLACFGAGIHNDLGLMKLQDCYLADNVNSTHVAGFGGAISSLFGALDIRHTVLNSNRVETTTVLASGGSIYSLACYTRVSDSDMNGNEVSALFLSSGGAAKNVASFTEIARCEMKGNRSGGGGAIANDYYGILQVDDSTLARNSVSGVIGAYGGGLRNEEGGQAVLRGCTISENRAKGKSKGGGIYNQCTQTKIGDVPVILASTLTLLNCTISSNIVDGKGTFDIPLEALGAGVYNGSSRAGVANTYIASCTIAYNRATNGLIKKGGGVYSTALSDIKVGSSSNNFPGLALVQLGNTLLANNIAGDHGEDCYNNFFTIGTVMVSLGYNMDSDGSGSLACVPSEQLLSGEARFRTAPAAGLGPLTHNGGHTFTHALLPGSSALNNGAPNGALSAELNPSTDQRGLARALGGRRDVGAFESVSPQGSPDSYVTYEDTPLDVPAESGVLANDFGDSPQAELLTAPHNGSLVLAPDGSFLYTPNPNARDSSSFTYRVVDIGGRTNLPVTVTLTIRPRLDLLAMNPLPNSIAERYSDIVLTFDEPVESSAILAYVSLSGSVTGPNGFSVAVDGTNVLLNPSRDFVHGEEIRVILREGLQSLAGSPFNPTITNRYSIHTNRPPTPGPAEFYTVTEDGVLNVASSASLLRNDADPDRDPLHVRMVHRASRLWDMMEQFGGSIYFQLEYEGTWPTNIYVYRHLGQFISPHGVVHLNADGTFTYRPNTNYVGTDTFQYFVHDDEFEMGPIDVTIQVTPVNDLPVAQADFYPNGTLTVPASSGVLANDLDIDGDILQAVLVTQTTHGTVSLATDGGFNYTPNAGHQGGDAFTYRARDASLSSAPVRVKIGNTAPHTMADFYTSGADAEFSVTNIVQGVLANDSDADGEVLTARLVTDAGHGTVTLNANGTFAYIPNPGYTSTDSFMYVANDGFQDSAQTRVKLGNTAPVTSPDDSYVVFTGRTLTVSAAQGVLGNDTDADGDSITAQAVSTPAHGTLAFDATGAFSYTPAADYLGNETFIYRATDGLTDATGAVTITVVDFLRVTEFSPARNAVDAASNAPIQITFNKSILTDSVIDRFAVHGSLSGRHACTVTVSSNRVTLQPTAAFAPGEVVSVSVRAGVRGAGFTQLDLGLTWQFTTRVSRGGAFFIQVTPNTNALRGAGVAVGDLNGDGRPDALVQARGTAPRLFFNNGNRTFTQRVESLGMDWALTLYANCVLADFNGDGSLDLAATTGYHNGTRVGLNDGSGNFTVVVLPSNSGGNSFMAAGDFDADGDIDLVAVAGGLASTWRNNGTGQFSLGPTTPLFANSPQFNSAISMAAGDIDGDGDLDLYVSGFSGDRVLLNEGTGTFAISGDAPAHQGSGATQLVDVDGDGDLDLLLGAPYLGTGVVWLNSGTGHFTRLPHPFVGNQTFALAVGDLNGDGDLDIFQGQSGAELVSLNNGFGRFTGNGQTLGMLASRGVALADLDGDGDLDAFAINGSGETPQACEAWYNQTAPLARDDFYAANGVSPIIRGATVGVLSNDVAGDGGPFTALLASNPAHGSIALNPNGAFTYTPNSGFAGTDVFHYRAADSGQTSAVARVKIGNTAPVAVADNYVAANDAQLRVDAPGVLGNDTDGEADPLSALLVTGPTNGTLLLRPDGSFLYTAVSNVSGADRFTYRAMDGLSTSAVTTVTLEVRARLAVVSMTPAPHALQANGSADIVLRFNHALEAATVPANVFVFGNYTGPRGVTRTVAGEALTLTAARAFLPGEHVTVTLAAGLEGNGGERLGAPVQFEFVVEAPLGGGRFADSGQRIGDTNYNSRGVALGDLNGDGALDAFIPNGPALNAGVPAQGPRVWFNDGNGVFNDSGQLLGTNFTFDASLADLNGDGHLDAVAHSSINGVHLYFNNGAGIMTHSPQTLLTNALSGVLPADIDNDGDADLVVWAEKAFWVWLNDGAGHFSNYASAASSLSLEPLFLVTLRLADLDNDGDLDLVVRQFSASQPTLVWLNDGRGAFTDSGQLFGRGGVGLALGDLNGDGFVDVVAPEANTNFVWLNNGSAGFGSSGQAYGNFIQSDVELADVNGDGQLDAVTLQRDRTTNFSLPLTNRSTVFFNNGFGELAPASFILGAFGIASDGSQLTPGSVAVGDLDGNGAPDLFLTGGFRIPNQVWLNGAGLPPIEGGASLVINDTATAAPFADVTVRGPLNVTLTVTLDDPAKGTFSGESLGAAGFTGPLNGTFTRAASTASAAQAAIRQLVFVPVPNRVPVDGNEVTTFTIIGSDGSVSRTNNFATVTSVSVNDGPIAANDSGPGFSGSARTSFVTANVLANDFDLDPSDTLTIVSVNMSETLGWVTNLGDGTFRYTPSTNSVAPGVGANGTDSFTYTIRDPHGGTATATVMLSLDAAHERPVARNDLIELAENAGFSVVTGELLLNDTNASGGGPVGLVISAVNTNGTRGRVQFDPGSGIAYDPTGVYSNLADGVFRTDTFHYTLSDASGASSNATVLVLIRGVDEPAVAVPDALTLSEHAVPTNLTATLLANDYDPDPNQTALLSLTDIDASATKGFLFFSNGVVSYFPFDRFQTLAAGQTATDTFGYTLRTPVSSTIAHTLVPLDLLRRDTFVDVRIELQPQGTLDVSFDGQSIYQDLALPDYTPLANARFALGARNDAGAGAHDIEALSLVMLAGSGTVETNYDFAGGAPAGWTLLGSAVVSNGFLRLTAPVPEQAGTCILPNLAGSNQVTGFTATFKARLGSGSEGFSFVCGNNLPSTPFGAEGAGDGLVVSFNTHDTGAGAAPAIDVKWRSRAAQGQVTLTIVGENDRPAAGADYLVLDERSGVKDITSELLGNDVDPDKDETATLRIVSVSTNGLPGTLTFSNGSVTYLPPTNLSLGKDQYTNFTCQYAVQDVHGQVSSNAVVTFYVVGDNSTPVAGADAVFVDEDSGAVNLTALLLANDTDADPGETATLVITSVSAASLLGQLTLADGIVTYDPRGQFNSLPAGSNVVQTFSYTVQDVNAAETTALVTLTVTGANDPPSASADALAVLESAGPTNITALLLANDRDADAGDGATLAISAIATPATRGLVTLNAGIIRYSANGAFNSLAAGATTNDLFHYIITDVQGGQATGAVTVTITGVNTGPSAVNNLATQTVQYSDAIAPVTITGSDPDSAASTLVATTTWRREGGTFAAGLPDGLTLTPNGPRQNSRDWTLAGLVRVAPGTYVVRVEIADDGGLKASTDVTLLVKPEDARANFTGALFASTASAESAGATVTLAATIQDITALPGEFGFDFNGGDIRNARVSFINRDNNTIIASNLPVGLVATNNLLTGTVVYNWNVNIGTANSQSFTVGIVVDGYYTRNASDDNTVVTVSKPMPSDFVTGGGYLVVTRSSGLVPGGNGTKANFGFNVKYNKSGQNLQGSINLIVRNASRVYQIKGTAMTSLSLSGKLATFNGKATIRDITDPLAPLSLDGNATLQVKMTDNGSPGSADTIAVTVWNKNGGLWFASNWDGKKTVEQLLGGGNLEVHSGGSGGAALFLQAGAPVSPHPIRLAITLAPIAGDSQSSMGTPGRVCVITFETTPGADYGLEYSTDMVTWTNLGTVTSYTATVRYFDETVSEGFRVYRARELAAP